MLRYPCPCVRDAAPWWMTSPWRTRTLRSPRPPPPLPQGPRGPRRPPSTAWGPRPPTPSTTQSERAEGHPPQCRARCRTRAGIGPDSGLQRFWRHKRQTHSQRKRQSPMNKRRIKLTSKTGVRIIRESWLCKITTRQKGTTI